MAKAKRRKVPISKFAGTDIISSKQKASRKVIRRFHVLIKNQAQLKRKNSLSASEVEELDKINDEIQGLGGLEWYQQMSAVGQGNDRGGGSEKIFIGWLKELKVHEGKQEKLLYVMPDLPTYYTEPGLDALFQIAGSRCLETRQLQALHFLDSQYTDRLACTASRHSRAGLPTFGPRRK